MFGTCTNVQVVEWLVGSFMHAHMPHACSCMVTGCLQYEQACFLPALHTLAEHVESLGLIDCSREQTQTITLMPAGCMYACSKGILLRVCMFLGKWCKHLLMFKMWPVPWLHNLVGKNELLNRLARLFQVPPSQQAPCKDGCRSSSRQMLVTPWTHSKLCRRKFGHPDF